MLTRLLRHEHKRLTSAVRKQSGKSSSMLLHGTWMYMANLGSFETSKTLVSSLESRGFVSPQHCKGLNISFCSEGSMASGSLQDWI